MKHGSREKIDHALPLLWNGPNLVADIGFDRGRKGGQGGVHVCEKMVSKDGEEGTQSRHGGDVLTRYRR